MPWTRIGMYETDNIHVDEHAQDAKVAARLLNAYNNCMSWREIHAETELKKFLVTASLGMLSGFQTSNDVLKQVSHRGAIRMPAYMVKGKSRRGLLQQFAVQRENRAERQDVTTPSRLDGSTDAFGWWKCCLSRLHENGADQGRDWIDLSSNRFCRVHR